MHWCLRFTGTRMHHRFRYFVNGNFNINIKIDYKYFNGMKTDKVCELVIFKVNLKYCLIILISI